MAFTAAQIVALACAEAKCPGFVSQAGNYLNLTLKDLWLHRDLKVNRKTQTVTASSGTFGPFALETDYQRTYDLFYLQNSLPYFLKPAAQEMFDAQFKDPAVGNYPYMYATDLSDAAQATFSTAGTLYIYPGTSASLSLTHRYMQQRADITTPETSSTIPWFADQDYLIKSTAYRLMGITDDERQAKYMQDCENMLRIHLIMAGDDEQQIVRSVKLDPWRFRGNRSYKPTKITD